MKIILIGYMGSGKSSVGKILAQKLNLPYKDLDEEIQKVEQMLIPELFAKKGEIYFRRAENKTLKDLLSSEEPFILATGGGTPCYADSLSAMLKTPNAEVVYLKTPLPVLVQRLMLESKTRPLVAHLNTKEEMTEFVGIHLFERSHFYNQAGTIIETAQGSPEQIAEEIQNRLF